MKFENLLFEYKNSLFLNNPKKVKLKIFLWNGF